MQQTQVDLFTDLQRLRLDPEHPIIAEWLGKQGFRDWETLTDPGKAELGKWLQVHQNQKEFRASLEALLYPIHVVNGKDYGWVGTQYIGRYHPATGHPGSPLANPYRVKEHGRDMAVQYYRVWLFEQYKEGTPALAELRRLLAIARKRPLVLSCWCAPEPCHGCVIGKCLAWLQRIGF